MVKSFMLKGRYLGGAEICQIWYTYLFYKSSSCSVSLVTFSKSVKALVMISYTSSYNNSYKLQSNVYSNINIKSPLLLFVISVLHFCRKVSEKHRHKHTCLLLLSHCQKYKRKSSHLQKTLSELLSDMLAIVVMQ